jgi:hypothetical protein
MGEFKSSIEGQEPEVTVDEMDKYGHFDAFEVQNKKKGFRYRFVNVNERNIAAKRRQGYEIVQSRDPEKIAMADNTPLKAGSSIDTTRRFNDVVLMRIPEEKFKRLQTVHANIQKRRTLTSIEQQFKAEVGPTAYREPGRGRYAESMTEDEFDASGGGTPVGDEEE